MCDFIDCLNVLFPINISSNENGLIDPKQYWQEVPNIVTQRNVRVVQVNDPIECKILFAILGISFVPGISQIRPKLKSECTNDKLIIKLCQFVLAVC